MTFSFPVDEAVSELKKALNEKGMAILKAPPGSGKTTVVPLRLLNESWLENKKIWILEPRRLAARLAALRMAEMTGTRVGETAGYHVRMERKAGPSTRIEVLTEGILTRRIQGDPMIEEAGIIIFDEFHERSIHADLGLALCLEIREVFRNDLKILVMSATMDTDRISGLMGGAPVINAEGSIFPVEVIYEKQNQAQSSDRIEKKVSSGIPWIMKETEGDLLVFLPGTGEIRRTAELLSEKSLPEGTIICQLHGNLSLKDQEKAIRPNPSGRRKIVLSTSIAETSLTIEGVRAVMDCGLSRVPRFNPGLGMTSLETVSVSMASAEQRRGRAGRMGPGKCFRLWPENRNPLFPDFSTPEIRTSDLCSFALELALWGVSSPSDLRLIDQPTEGAFNQALNLLKMLGAIDKNDMVTEKGREMASLGVHPRLASMLILGRENGLLKTASRIAAILGERDILNYSSNPDEDMRSRLEILEKISRQDRDAAKRADPTRCRRVIETASFLEKKAGYMASDKPEDSDMAGFLMASAYPERLAKIRDKRGSFITRSSGGAFLPETSHIAGHEYIAIADMTSGNSGTVRGNSRIRLAAPITKDEIKQLFKNEINIESETSWNDRTLAVESKRVTFLGSLVIEEKIEKNSNEEELLTSMISGIRKNWPSILPWTVKTESLVRRVYFLKNIAGFDDLPDLMPEKLEKNLESWLKPYLHGMSKADDLKRLDMEAIFMSMIGWEKSKLLESEAPEKFKTPSGSSISIDYPEPDGKSGDHPVIRVKLQEMFGLKSTPCLGSKKIPVMLHLLSPASRPVQITMDLEGFWKSSYLEVKKEMKGRYPKHFWPDDPSDAPATRGTKPKNF